MLVVVRVTLRITAATYRRSVDVSLPTSSSLSEVLPELARLIQLPDVGRPWEFTTAAGAPLDPHVPLDALKLRDGHIICVRPAQPVEPPVVRDAAEALLAAGDETRPAAGLGALGSAAGAGAAGILTGSALIGLAAAACIALAVAVVARSKALFTAGAAAAATATAAWVAGGTELTFASRTDLAFGLLCGCGASLALIAAGAISGLIGARGGASLATVAAIAGASAALPALAVLLGVGAVMASPAIATRVAGLEIPRVPTAGQDLDVADAHQVDVDARAATARLITDGIAAGVAISCIPALALLAWDGGWWVFAFALCVAGSLIIHAARHHAPVPRVALCVTALAAVVAACTAVARMDSPHPALMVAAGLVALVCSTAAVWAPKVPELEPTTLVWLERAEAAAIIAVIPLAVFLTGAFDAIRGL